jgi:extracellular factor (EF) 3-hydroxypalmitic acid methyl ester biosynthesis protein
MSAYAAIGEQDLFPGEHQHAAHQSAAAMRRLRRVCEQVLSLEDHELTSPTELLHVTAASLHAFAASILACEDAGLDRADITPCLTEVRALHARSPFVERLQTWPRGYPGDFETVEWLCDADNRGRPGTTGWAIEQYALQSPVAQQHRNKVDLQARAIMSTVTNTPRARVASIGCGGCRDLSLIQPYILAGDATFVLVDADAEALGFARRRLEAVRTRCAFVRGRVPRVLSNMAAAECFDLVVAGGLFDYLPDRWAVATLRAIRRLLAPQGRLLFSNIGAGNPFRPWLEYLAEWRLIERDESDLRRLLRDAGFTADHVHVYRDTSMLAFMVDVRVG